MLWWTVAMAEFRRGWLIKKRYPLDLLFSMGGGIIFMVTVVGAAMMITKGSLTLNPDWGPRIWGLVLVSLSGSAMSGGIGYINQHTYTGTMEQVALSPVRLSSLILIRQTITFLVGFPVLVVYALCILWVFPLATGSQLAISVLVTYFGMIGVGLVLAGLAMIFKQLESLVSFLGMILYPIPLMVPDSALTTFVFSIFPFGWGFRIAMQDLSHLWGGVLVSGAWMLFGYGFFQRAEGLGRRKGVIGQF